MEKYLFRTEIQIKDGALSKDDFSCRILNRAEIENMTEDAIEHLIDLRLNFNISDELFEEVLVDMSYVPTIIDLECLKSILDYKGVNSFKVIN